jgi:XTP/dITP diphosphohydrolase
MKKNPGEAFVALVEVIARLRGPDGCPWDQAQTHRSLIPYLIEEAYEVTEAIEGGNPEKLKDELGDLLLQVLLHTRMEEEEGRFSITEVVENLREKLVRRHPHVFGEVEARTPDEVRGRWEEIKEKEGKGFELGTKPALLAARKFVEREQGLGRKIILPRRITWDNGDPETVVGEVLLEAVLWAKEHGVEPEAALRREIAKRLDGEKG